MSNAKDIRGRALALYIITLLLLWLPALFPGSRLWGFSYWSYWPTWIRLLLFAVCLVGGVYLYHRVAGAPASGKRKPRDSAVPSALSGIQIFLLVAGHAILFYVLRTQTHFLGDGYLRLNQLANGTPLYQAHNLGETFLEFGIRGLLPFPDQLAALVTYRSLAIVAGATFITVMAQSARRLFATRTQQLLWTLVMTSGGFSLIFFGYVENYALFGMSVGVFTAIGLLASLGHLSVWWIVPILLLNVSLHGFGIALAPAAAYLMLTRLGLDTWLRSRTLPMKVMLAPGLVAAAAGVLYVAGQYSGFVKYAFVPLQDGWRTVEGYTLFSTAHILDLVNLVFLLIPGVLLLLWLATRSRVDHQETAMLRAREFLLACVVVVVAVVFLLEAKLGMPRDWDLFSFAGIPILAYVSFFSISSAAKTRWKQGTLALVVALGYIALFSRATVLAVPDLGVEQFVGFARLDMKKNRAAWFTLAEYYKRTRNRAGLEEVARIRVTNYPEEQLVIQARQLMAQGRADEVASLSRQAIRINPMHFMPWLLLGQAQLEQRVYDSALEVIETADALNPNSRFVLKHLGRAYYHTGRIDEAEKCWLETHRLDPNEHETTLFLARLYQAHGDRERYASFLEEASYQPQADGQLARELGDLKLQAGDVDAAARAYSHALENGVSVEKLKDAFETHPELKTLVSPQSES